MMQQKRFAATTPCKNRVVLSGASIVQCSANIDVVYRSRISLNSKIFCNYLPQLSQFFRISQNIPPNFHNGNLLVVFLQHFYL